MSGITGRLRSLLDAVPRRMVLFVVLVAVDLGISFIGGRYAKAWDIAALVAGAVLINATGGALRSRTRRTRPAPTYLDAVPVAAVSPLPDPEILMLVLQGRKIQAIKRYRQMNPGIGLKQAKDVIDGL